MGQDIFSSIIRRDSFFGRLNAGVKMGVMFLLIIAIMITKDPVTSLGFFSLQVVLVSLSGFNLLRLSFYLWPLLVALLTTGWSTALLAPKTGEMLWDFGLNSISTGSLEVALNMMLRALAMTIPSLVFVMSTDPTDLGDALAQRWRLPARFVLAALVALRLVGVLFGEWHALGQARRARGLGAGQSWWGRMRTAAGQCFALLVQAIRRGSRLAVTMEARGFGAGRRTWARESTVSRADYAVCSVAVLMIIAVYGISAITGSLTFIWS